MADFILAIPLILRHEGGFVAHPSDPGGATNYGISLRYLNDAKLDINEYGLIDVGDIRALSPDSASVIYKKYWWDKYNYEAINDQAIATKIFDMAVNMGASQAHKLVQRAANAVYGGAILQVDGVLGPKTLQLLNELHPKRLLIALREFQASFYRELARKNRDLSPFLRGWLNRAAA
jgi:lysozyme family protein